LLAKDY